MSCGKTSLPLSIWSTLDTVWYYSGYGDYDHLSFVISQVNTMALNTDYAIRTGAFDPVQKVVDQEISSK